MTQPPRRPRPAREADPVGRPPVRGWQPGHAKAKPLPPPPPRAVPDDPPPADGPGEATPGPAGPDGRAAD